MSLPRGAALIAAVAAILMVGCGEPPTAPDATSAPAAPSALLSTSPTTLSTTALSASTIKLDWNDRWSDEAGFEVWRSTTGSGGNYTLRTTLAANTKTWKDTGLTAGKEHCYQVRALGAGGTPPSEFSNTSCATTLLKTPLSVAARAAGPTAITVTWKDNSSSEAGFEVWRSTTGSSGSYSLRTSVAANITGADDIGLTAGTQYCYKVRAIGEGGVPSSKLSAAACATPSGQFVVRIVLLGDSNTDRCEEVLPPNRLSSYVSAAPRLGPNDAHLACSVAGKVQTAWQAARTDTVRVVNHGIASSTTGGGLFGGPNRTKQGAPNARTKVGGVTRFQGEVLGQAYPWSGGEPVNSSFPTGPVLRVNAFTPGPSDFAYVSMGTNDDAGPDRTMTAAQTEANLRWMVQQWIAAGRAPDHFILTTLAPRDDANSPTSISSRNTLIRALATELGVHLIDLADHTSADNGATWKNASPSLNIGDGIHYTEAVRAWLGDQVASWMSAETPAGP